MRRRLAEWSSWNFREEGLLRRRETVGLVVLWTVIFRRRFGAGGEVGKLDDAIDWVVG